MRQYSILLISLILLILLNGCSYKKFETHNYNDELLDCKKLTTKIADLIDYNGGINSTTGIENKSLVQWIFWPPLGVYNESKAYISKESLDKRFENLINLKQKNNCAITSKEKDFMINKKRIFGN
ncbi:MAG: hypothetical protein U9Q33_08680 [Campylobacterota bacterium]|nr:hypothetical protein [Campylobacterota bacterium]